MLYWKQNKLACVLAALLDMQITTDDKMLEKYGLKANDAVLVNDSQKGMFVPHSHPIPRKRKERNQVPKASKACA